MEDSPNGIRAALAAGLTVAAIPRTATTLPGDLKGLVAAEAEAAHDALPAVTALLTSPEPAQYAGVR